MVTPRVDVLRGPVVESSHRIHLAVADASGNLVQGAGDPELVTFLRSAAKPFQALPLVTSGAADRFALTPAELAVCCASHVGEPRHVEAVSALLSRAGLDPSLLVCGTHAPRSARSERTPIHHNCSGNHAAMLLAQLHLGGEARDYWRPESLVQRAIIEAIAEAAGARPVVATDNCGVPAFALPLRAAATAFARLAMPQKVSKETGDALQRIARAMTLHPEMVGGTRAFDTDVMGASEDRLVSKGGAEGYQAAGDLASGLGLALKVEDGDAQKRAAPAATVEALRQLAWLEGRAFEVLGDWWRPAVKGWAGAVVGEVRPVLDLA